MMVSTLIQSFVQSVLTLYFAVHTTFKNVAEQCIKLILALFFIKKVFASSYSITYIPL
jgi:hypothetical protein